MRVSFKRSTQLLDRPEAYAPPSAQIETCGRDRLLLLIPEGSLSFRLLSFPDAQRAQDYLSQASALTPISHWVALWTHDSKPVDSGGTALPAESVILLRDESRPGFVQLVSFLAMSAALAHLRTSLQRGLDPMSVLIYWVTAVVLAPPSVEDPERITRPTTAPDRTTLASPKAFAEDGSRYSHPKLAITGALRTPNQVQHKPNFVQRMSSRILSWPGWHGLPSRIIAAAVLQRDCLDGVKDDPHATGRAVFVVLAGAMSAGIGTTIAGGVANGAASVMATVVGWTVCAVTISVIGRQVFGANSGDHSQQTSERSSASRVLQTVGLASGPALLLVIAAVPVFGPLLVMAVFAWLLATMTVAAQMSLGLDLESSALTAGTGWLLFFAIAVVAPSFFA